MEKDKIPDQIHTSFFGVVGKIITNGIEQLVEWFLSGFGMGGIR